MTTKVPYAGHARSLRMIRQPGRYGSLQRQDHSGRSGDALVIPVQVGMQTKRKDSSFEYRYFSSASYRIPVDRVPADDPDAT